jgi:hypothetical protein
MLNIMIVFIFLTAHHAHCKKNTDICMGTWGHHADPLHWLLGHTKTNLNLKYVAPCYYVIVTKNTPISIRYYNCRYFVLIIRHAEFILSLEVASIRKPYVVNTISLCAFTSITRHANRSACRHIMFDRLRPVRLCHIFCHHLINGTILADMYQYVPIILNVCFISSTTVIWNLLQPRNLQWYIITYILVWFPYNKTNQMH